MIEFHNYGAAPYALGTGGGYDSRIASMLPLAWYDPSDLSTLWKDTAATDPVTADGDMVARMDDKSGNGHHALQATTAKRPLYKTSSGLHWLEPDGVDDSMVTSAIDLTVTDKLSFATAIQAGSAQKMIFETGNLISNKGGYLFFKTGPAWEFALVASGAGRFATQSVSSTDKAVLTAIMDASLAAADELAARRNGTAFSSSTGDAGSGAFSNAVFNLFSRGGSSLNFDGKFYGLTFFARVMSNSEKNVLESYYSQKSAAVLA